MSQYQDVVAVSDDGRFRAVLEYDEDPMNPRTDYDTGTWFVSITPDGLSSDGNGADYEHIYSQYDYSRNVDDMFARHIWLAEGRRVTRVSTQYTEGYLIEDDDRLAEITEYGGTIVGRDTYLNCVSADLVSYCYGDVYGVIIQQANSLDEDGNGDDWNSIDSC